jgi:hypothetical protein
MNNVFCIVQRGDLGLDVNAFVQDTSRCRLPYEFHNANSLWFRCYLLLGDRDRYGLYFHGPHAIMDGVSTLNAFALMFQWMTNDTTEPVANLPWGTEWRNVPLGPVSATDDPREDWDIAGVELLKPLLDSEVPHTVCFPWPISLFGPFLTRFCRSLWLYGHLGYLRVPLETPFAWNESSIRL